MRAPVHFLILTPTYKRLSLLRKFLRRLSSQTYPHWTAAVVHDGPGPLPTSSDRRVHFLHTPEWKGDLGASARLYGCRYFNALFRKQEGMYALLWDDDNAFWTNALRSIARAVARADYPDLLLVPFSLRNRILPPLDRPVNQLALRDLDSANLVVRFELAQAALSEGVGCSRTRAKDYGYYRALQCKKNLIVKRADEIAPVGLYDGLRLYSKIPLLRRHAYWLYPERIKRSVNSLLFGAEK